MPKLGDLEHTVTRIWTWELQYLCLPRLLHIQTSFTLGQTPLWESVIAMPETKSGFNPTVFLVFCSLCWRSYGNPTFLGVRLKKNDFTEQKKTKQELSFMQRITQQLQCSAQGTFNETFSGGLSIYNCLYFPCHHSFGGNLLKSCISEPSPSTGHNSYCHPEIKDKREI